MTTNAETMTGAELFVECIRRAGIKKMFAYPGGQSIILHQAFSKYKNEIEIVLPRHEQGGGFMAGGFARATGKTALCMATSGPGATNLVTAIADAYADSVPVVFVTGQVPSTSIGKNAFQECDFIGMTRPVVKHSFLVMDAADLPRIVKEAFYLAGAGRPGPIVIDIPKNVQVQRVVPVFDEAIEPRVRRKQEPASEVDIEEILEALEKAQRPCVYYGGGIIAADAASELREFVHAFNIPAACSLMGIGALPDDDPLCLRNLGMHGSYAANYAVNKADVLLVFGARFSDRVTGDPARFAPHTKIFHIDIDSAEINKNVKAYRGYAANIKTVLKKLNEKAFFRPYEAWHDLIYEWKIAHTLNYDRASKRLLPQFVIETLSRVTDGNAVIVPGVGQHQMWCAQYYRYKHPRQLLTSGGLGTMGFGLPTAIGAKIACPEALVVNVDGDGSFQMNIQELATIFAEDVDVKMVILNNQYLGMVAQWEDRFYHRNHAQTDLHVARSPRPYPDFVTIARGYGIDGEEVASPDDLEAALRRMIEHKGAYVLDVHVPYESDHVLPMIPPNGTYSDIVTE